MQKHKGVKINVQLNFVKVQTVKVKVLKHDVHRPQVALKTGTIHKCILVAVAIQLYLYVLLYLQRWDILHGVL